MTKPITTYEPFDIVIVPFPFTDRLAAKRRPALVLSESIAFHRNAPASICAMITTSSRKPWPLDLKLQNLSPTGLHTPSIIRLKLFTLDHILILRKIGELSEEDKQEFQETFKRGFASCIPTHAVNVV